MLPVSEMISLRQRTRPNIEDEVTGANACLQTNHTSDIKTLNHHRLITSNKVAILGEVSNEETIRYIYS